MSLGFGKSCCSGPLPQQSHQRPKGLWDALSTKYRRMCRGKARPGLNIQVVGILCPKDAQQGIRGEVNGVHWLVVRILLNKTLTTQGLLGGGPPHSHPPLAPPPPPTRKTLLVVLFLPVSRGLAGCGF